MSTQPSNKGKQNGQPIRKPLVWQKNFRAPVECHYSDADATIIKRAIDAVARGGGAIMFGVTSDGGAYSLCVLHDDSKVKDYPHGVDELHEALLGVEAMFVDN